MLSWRRRTSSSPTGSARRRTRGVLYLVRNRSSRCRHRWSYHPSLPATWRPSSRVKTSTTLMMIWRLECWSLVMMSLIRIVLRVVSNPLMGIRVASRQNWYSICNCKKIAHPSSRTFAPTFWIKGIVWRKIEWKHCWARSARWLTKKQDSCWRTNLRMTLTARSPVNVLRTSDTLPYAIHQGYWPKLGHSRTELSRLRFYSPS